MNRYFATFHRRGSMTKKHQTWSILWLQRHVTHVSIVSIFRIHGQYFFLHYASILCTYDYICTIYHSHNWSEAINKNKDNGVLVLILDSNDVDVGRLEGLPNFRTLLIIKGQRVSLQPVSFF